MLLSNTPRKNNSSLRCKGILGGKSLFMSVAAIFDFMTEEDWGG